MITVKLTIEQYQEIGLTPEIAEGRGTCDDRGRDIIDLHTPEAVALVEAAGYEVESR